MMATRRLAAGLPRAFVRHGILLVTSALMLVPIVWMVSLSLKPPGEIFRASFSLLPEQWHAVANYTKALTTAPLGRFMLNGVVVCTAILALQILFCAPAAYALAKLRFAGRGLMFGLVLIALLIPPQVLALPLYMGASSLGLLNSYTGLVLPYVVSPFAIFLFRQFFKTVSDDLVHAARLDGLSEFAIIWRIMMPLAWPVVAAFSIFSVALHWNDLFWPLIVIDSERLMPPPLGVVAFRNDEAGSDYGPLMAGATIIVAPLIAAFLMAQRWFIEGLSTGAVK